MKRTKRVLSLFLVLCLLLSCVSVAASAVAVTISPKPENGTTQGQPFAPGTAGSQNFRIPGIVTLNDGTLIAVCDARWNGTGDSAGLDTIVSVSKDNGKNWTYTFANYLGDNGNVRDTNSSCIIDPAIATDGTTAYLIADLFPAGFATNSAKYYAQAGSTGFDASGNLLLRSDAENSMEFGVGDYAGQATRATYGYYLANGKIYTTAGAEVEGYTVDAYFNITGNGISTNLFYADSPYKPYPHDYLYMTTSTDGLNWSVPTLLNLKETTESALLVGPGNGIYDKSTGNMVFTAYRHGGGNDERACLIWKDTNGNWHRTENATASSWSSESTVVELNNGTLRVFYRDGYNLLRYTDYVWSAEENDYVRDVNATEVSTTVSKTHSNQLTAIKYSKKIDGKDAILVANANGSGRDRLNGYLSVFLVNEDNSMELARSYDIFPGENEYYAYNCITEMDDGNIALLYENGAAAITFLTIDMEKVLDRANDPSLTVKEVELLAGYSATFTDNSGYYVNADITELDTKVATLTMTGEETTTNAAQVLGSGANIDLDSCQYTFTANSDGTYEVSGTTADGETVYLNHFSTTSNSIPNIATAGKIEVRTSSHENMFKLVAKNIDGSSNPDRGLHFHMEAATPYWNRCGSDTSAKCHEYLYRKAAANETASQEIPGYVRITSLNEIKDGGKYLIAAKNDAGNWYVLNPSASTEQFNHVAQIMGSTTVGTTELTFTGVAGGYTEVVVGSTLYKLTVYDVAEVPVDLTVDESVTVTETSGNYADADTSALDTEIATVVMTGVDGTAANGLSTAPVSTLTDGTYVIVNTRANKLVTNAPVSAEAAAGAGSGLNMSGSKTGEIEKSAVWTITKVDGGYTAQDADGNYMTIGSNSAGVSTNITTLSLNYNGTTWTIAKDGAYLNHFGGGSSTCAAGWQDGSAAGDAGSQFEIYSYTDEPHGPSTELTFTGVKPGTTELLVGHTKFIITVQLPAHDCPAPDCIKDQVCEVCGKTVEAFGSHLGEWTVETAADCENEGKEVFACERCEFTDERTTDALGHDLKTETVELTCTQDGYTLYTCQRENCGYHYAENVRKAPGHDYKETVTAPTCTANGYTTYTCECGHSYVDNIVPALGHDYEETVTAPTCTTNGYTTYTCECGHSYVDNIVPALGHDYEETVTAATCTAMGYTTYVCEVCQDTYVDGIKEALGHNLETVVTAPTHNTMGFSTTSCSECDYSLVHDYVDALEHKFEKEVTKPATCTAEGEMTFTCECGETYTQPIPMTEHSCDVTVTAPTCTANGYTTYTCECGHSYVDDIVSALGHDYKKTVTAATCTVTGYTTYTCECGHSYVDDIVPALGHDYKETVTAPTCNDFGYTLFQCRNCDHSYINDLTDKLEHKSTVIGQKDATCTKEGYTGNTVCSVCDQVLELGTVIKPLEKCPSEAYSDVDVNAWYHESVDYVITNDLMNGTDKTVFSPLADTTRAMMATLLYRMAGEPDVTALDNPFSDLAEGSWYYDAVVWAANQEVVNGITATTFAPNKSITREQMVTMLYRYNGSEDVDKAVLNAYTDAKAVSDYAADAFAWAISNKIVTGMTETTLAPGATANRAQIATILMRYLES